jgi:hypothetical protein
MKVSPISVRFEYPPITNSDSTGHSWACSGTRVQLRSTTLLTEAPLNSLNISLQHGAMRSSASTECVFRRAAPLKASNTRGSGLR